VTAAKLCGYASASHRTVPRTQPDSGRIEFNTPEARPYVVNGRGPGPGGDRGPRPTGGQDSRGPRPAGTQDNRGPRPTGGQDSRGPRPAGAQDSRGPRPAGPPRDAAAPRPAGARPVQLTQVDLPPQGEERRKTLGPNRKPGGPAKDTAADKAKKGAAAKGKGREQLSKQALLSREERQFDPFHKSRKKGKEREEPGKTELTTPRRSSGLSKYRNHHHW